MKLQKLKRSRCVIQEALVASTRSAKEKVSEQHTEMHEILAVKQDLTELIKELQEVSEKIEEAEEECDEGETEERKIIERQLLSSRKVKNLLLAKIECMNGNILEQPTKLFYYFLLF